MNPGMIGGIVGSVVGIIGGIIGTYFSIKNTNGPNEKAFMIKVAIVVWISVGGFLALLLTLPKPFNWFVWIPYLIFLPIFIRIVNRKQLAIRDEEHR